MSEVEEGRPTYEDVPGLEEFMREVTKDDPPDPPEEDLHSLARSLMQQLSEEGLSKNEETMPAPAKESHNPLYLRSNFTKGEALYVQLDSGQTVWLQLGSRISKDQKYKRIKVFSETSRSDEAVIAALAITRASILRTKSIVERVPLSVRLIERQREELTRLGLRDSIPVDRNEEVIDELLKLMREPELEGATPLDAHPTIEVALTLVEDVLRYYRPRLEELPSDERIALIEHLSLRMHKALKAWQEVMEFAEYGTPKGSLGPTIKNVVRDVRAAELKYIDGLKDREIAEELGEPRRSEASKMKNDYPTTRGRIKRGQDFLKKAYGEEEWAEFIKTVQDDAADFQKLPDFLQWIELQAYRAAEFLGISFAQALGRELWYVEYRADKLRIPPEQAAMLYAEHGTLEGIDPKSGEAEPPS